MSSRKNAAIILLGMGENNAAEILKTLGHKEVESIIEVMNGIDEVREDEVIKALNEFFKETQKISGLHSSASGDYIRNSLVNAIGADKAESMINLEEASKSADLTGLELLKWQSTQQIVDALQDEHPQVIMTALMYVDSEKAADILKQFPKELRTDVIMRMTHCKQISHFALKSLSDYLQEEFTQSEKYKKMASDGVKLAANILSKLDVDTENELLSSMNEEDQELTEKIQEQLFPFESLVDLDGKSLQVLMSEASNEDLVLALKGVDDSTKSAFFKSMSSKNADLVQDDIDSLGPVKLNDVLQAQKRIITLAKQLNDEEKIWIPTGDSDSRIM